MNNNNINTPYKDSPLGKIPGDWDVKKLEKITEKIGDGLHGTPEYVSSSEYYFINGNNLKDGLVQINADTKCVSKEEYCKHKKELKYKTILLSINGTIGSIAFYKNENIVLGKSAAYINCKDENVDYLYYYLQSESTVIFFEGELTGSTIRNLSLKSIREIPVSLPPLPEQKAIAHVLGLMDSAININNKLIAKKELQKKWLMQNLLTGKKRLKGNFGEWNEYKLKDCFHFIKSYSISRDGLSREQGKQYCIHYGDIHAYYDTDFIDFITQSGIPRIIDNVVNVDPDDYLHDGDIIIADASEDYGGVGEAVEVINIQDKIVVGGLHTIVLRDFSGVTSSLFRAYLFNSERVRNELRKKATGTSVYSVTKTTLESLVFKLPPLNEQSSIAMALQAADKEIQLLKAKTEKLREQKKGLMQVLLTGKKRLIIN